MSIKTKFRFDIIPIIFITISLLTVLPYFAFSKLIEGHDRSYFTEPSIFLLFIFLGLLWGGILIYLYYDVITKTLVVTINNTEKIIYFNYPFKFQRRKYFYEEVIGFRFSSIYTRICDFKTLIIKTKNNRQYTISEFQISNFKAFELFLLEHFNLTKGIGFENLTDKEKEDELIRNREFEIEQAKSYRLTCYFQIVLIAVVLYLNMTIAIPDRKFGLIAYGFCIGFFIFLLVKIVKANRTIKNYS